jgi:hypothetical protein
VQSLVQYAAADLVPAGAVEVLQLRTQRDAGGALEADAGGVAHGPHGAGVDLVADPLVEQGFDTVVGVRHGAFSHFSLSWRDAGRGRPGRSL